MGMSLLPTILIAIGVGFLLYNLNVIPFTPWELLWPGLIIALSLSQLRDLKRRPQSSRQSSKELVFWLVVNTFGFYLLLPRIGISVPSLPWKIVWPVLLILFGILKLFPGNWNFVQVKKAGFNKQEPHYQSSLLGEIRRGPANWVLDDLYLRQGIGSVALDLTQAIIPQRKIDLHVSGYIGDVVLYLPPGLAFQAECSLALGEITVLERNESGSQKHMFVQTEDYQTAQRKLDIKIRWRIGEVRIVQIQ